MIISTWIICDVVGLFRIFRINTRWWYLFLQFQKFYVWKKTNQFLIAISQEHIDSWRLRGDIFDENICNDVVIKTNQNEENNFNPSGLNLQTGDGDAGPAPLQNNVNVTEDFEGIINFGNNCCVSNASTAENVVDETIHSIQSNAQNHVDRTRETITFRQSDVLKLNRFL